MQDSALEQECESGLEIVREVSRHCFQMHPVPVQVWALDCLSFMLSWARICEEAAAFQCQKLLELNKEILSLWDSISFPLFARLEWTWREAFPSP